MPGPEWPAGDGEGVHRAHERQVRRWYRHQADNQPAALLAAAEHHGAKAGVDVVILSAAWDLDDAESLAETLFYLKPYVGKVIVVGRIPGHLAPLPDLLARAMLRHDDQLVLTQQSLYPFAVDQLFKQALPAGSYVSLTDALCPAGRCRVWAAPGVPLQFDGDHLTSEGSLVLASYLASHLRP